MNTTSKNTHAYATPLAVSLGLLAMSASLDAQAASAKSAAPTAVRATTPSLAQWMRGVTPSRALRNLAGPRFVLIASKTADSKEIPGIEGDLELDERSLQSIPLHSVAAFEAQLALRTHTQGHAWFQTLSVDAHGKARLSRLREFGIDPSMRFAQRDSESTCRARVQLHLAQVANTEMAEGWSRLPAITRVTALFRPDVRGVAYYEYELDLGGFVIASTGEHDRAIPNWSSVGTTKSRQLAAQSELAPAKIYKLDTLCYVSEDATGTMLASLGQLPDRIVGLPALLRATTQTPRELDRHAWKSWAQLKAQYAETYRPLLRQMRDRHAEQWRAERRGGVSPMSWSSWTTYSADGGSSAQPLYNQHTYRSCAVGCGPVAWAMVFGWADRQAHNGNPSWSGRTGIYRTNGSRYGSSSAVASLTWDYGATVVAEELNRRMGTWCIAGSGATWPSRMDDAQGYLSGRTGARASSGGSDIGANLSSYRDQLRSSIVTRDTPAVMGTGFLNHYPVAFKYAWRKKTDFWGTHYQRMFYINNGWGSSSHHEWVDDGTFLYGVLRR